MCSSLLLSFPSWKIHLFFFLYWKKSITPIPENLLESTAVCIIKRRCDSPAVATQQLAQQQHISWSHTEEWFCVVLCGWRRFFFFKWRGWSTTKSNVRGRSWSTLHLPIRAISHSHMAWALAEQSGGPVCGREAGPRNLHPQSNANFQINTLGKAGTAPQRA